MKSEPPPNSASFDSLWDSLDAGEEDLPPALAPRLQGTVVPQEDRDTLLPPVPPGDYVSQMMELGELDDPADLAPAPRAEVPIPPMPPLGNVRALGLVLASERELLLEGDAEPPRPPPAPRGPAGLPSAGSSRRRSTGRFPALQQRAEASGPLPRQAMGMGARAMAAAHALPVPRAPSIPPLGAEPGIAAFEGLGLQDPDTLDGLGSFDSLGGHAHTPPGPPAELGAEPRRYTPPALSLPTSSKPFPTSPGSPRRAPAPAAPAGLRLGKRTPVPFPPVVPAAIDLAAARGDEAPASEPAPSSLPDRAREMAALFDAHNYSSALVLAESVLVSDPSHAPARRCAEACREMLTEKYLGNLGGRANIPRVTMGAEEIRWLSLDHRAGFLLSFVDGTMSIEEVLDVSSMPELDALRIMFELRMQGVIEIVEPNRRPGRRQ